MRRLITGSASATRTDRALGPRTSSQWWKACVLLSSLGATVVGWMALPSVKSPADGVVVSRTVTATSAEVLAFPANAIVEPRRQGSSVRSLPTMPQKPVFQAPVTRTRRS